MLSPVGGVKSGKLRGTCNRDVAEGASKDCGDGSAPDGRNESVKGFDMIPWTVACRGCKAAVNAVL